MWISRKRWDALIDMLEAMQEYSREVSRKADSIRSELSGGLGRISDLEHRLQFLIDSETYTENKKRIGELISEVQAQKNAMYILRGDLKMLRERYNEEHPRNLSTVRRNRELEGTDTELRAGLIDDTYHPDIMGSGRDGE